MRLRTGEDRLLRPQNPSNPDLDGFDQRPTWRPEEIPLDDGRALVLEDS
jgi:hypothetical protein